jgi:hypothetical protein
VKVKRKKSMIVLKGLLMSLILAFTVPIFALAASPSEVTYDVKGATGNVPTQAQFDSFITGYSYLFYIVDANSNLSLLRSNVSFVATATDVTTSSGASFSRMNYDGGISSWSTTSLVNSTGSGVYTVSAPPPDPPPPDPDPTDPPTQGGDNLFTNLTTTAITTSATGWANNYNDLLLVVVGLGVGFACVRFVKGLFM